MEQLLSDRDWANSLPYPTDKVIVRNLLTTANAGVDVWGRKEKQPAHISLTLHLKRPFDSAAQNDVVDHSTIHYGILSRDLKAAIEAGSENWRSTAELASLVEEIILQSSPSSDVLEACEMEIFYPKGSILGEGVGYNYRKSFSTGKIARSLHLKKLRMPCDIGANEHERQRKQAVIVNLWVDCMGQAEGAESSPKAEEIISKEIEASSFATLESLATTISDKLVDGLAGSLSPGFSIRLRIEKPLAIPFADAPAIEMVRFAKGGIGKP